MDHERKRCPLKKRVALGNIPAGSPELSHPTASSVLLLTPPGSSPQPCSVQGNHLPSLALEGPAHAGDGGEDGGNSACFLAHELTLFLGEMST